MIACAPAVHPHAGLVIDCAKVEYSPVVIGLTVPLKRALEPDGPLIEEQLRVLGVPITGDIHHRGLVKIIFYKVLGVLGLGVPEESPCSGVHAVIIVAFLLHINYVIPLSVERCNVTCPDVGQLRHLYSRCVGCCQADSQ